jgi:hypothetical protein
VLGATRIPSFRFNGNPFFSPGDVFRGHRAHQLLDLFWNRRSSYWSRFPAPEKTEAFPVPTDESVGLYDHQSAAPVEPPFNAAMRKRVASVAR